MNRVIVFVSDKDEIETQKTRSRPGEREVGRGKRMVEREDGKIGPK